MPRSPFLEPADQFEFVNRGLDAAFGENGNIFNSQTPPAQTGLGTRQGTIRPNREAITTRQVMQWLVPEQPIITMYINPRNVQYNYNKLTTETRTKGGYVLQYWGEGLTTITISGTTGTSGIEGINILRDVYRNEQLMFDPFALFLEAQRDAERQEDFDDLLLGPNAFGIVGDVVSSLRNAQRGNSFVNNRNKPTLASLAFSVELYWQGAVYRGFFKSFDYTENVDRLGLFDYNMSFTVTQERGYRLNSFAWQKSPNGVSTTKPKNRAYSYGSLSSIQFGQNPIFRDAEGNPISRFQEITPETTTAKNILNNANNQNELEVDEFEV